MLPLYFCICSIISTYVSTFLPDSFGNYSHYVFSLMDVNDTGRINFQVQNVQNTDADSIVKHSPLSPFHYPGLSGNSVHHGEGLRQGEDAVGGQALWHRRRRLHQRRGARGRDILGEFCWTKYLDICINYFIPKVFDLMGRGKEDEELIKIAVRDKIKNIHEVDTF